LVVVVPLDFPPQELAEAEDEEDTETLAAEAVVANRPVSAMTNMYLIGFSSLCEFNEWTQQTGSKRLKTGR